jgi:membrane protein implicated in regulation of membrane protease activity
MDLISLAASPWLYLGLAVVFSGVELASGFSLTTIWFALAALATSLLSALTGVLPVGIRWKLLLAVFLVISVLLLVFTRPFAVKKLRVGHIKTNVDALAGRDAPVLKAITGHDSGEIKLDGKVWTAVAENGETIPEGETCTVVKIEGVHAVVIPRIL